MAENADAFHKKGGSDVEQSPFVESGRDLVCGADGGRIGVRASLGSSE